MTFLYRLNLGLQFPVFVAPVSLYRTSVFCQNEATIGNGCSFKWTKHALPLQATITIMMLAYTIWSMCIGSRETVEKQGTAYGKYKQRLPNFMRSSWSIYLLSLKLAFSSCLHFITSKMLQPFRKKKFKDATRTARHPDKKKNIIKCPFCLY